MTDIETGWHAGGYMPGCGHCSVCGARIRQGSLMCGLHWSRVPKALRAILWDALHAWNAGTGTLGRLREAQKTATKAVER